MELSRRDALAALAAGGLTAGVGTILTDDRSDAVPVVEAPVHDPETPAQTEATSNALTRHHQETFDAIARIIYPSELTGIAEFVETYRQQRVTDPTYRAGATAAIDRLDDRATEWADDQFRALDTQAQNRILQETGVDTADADPDGSPAERIRYYLVNELLYALYTSPTGSELVGLENPQGHPGGLTSYQHGPNQTRRQ